MKNRCFVQIITGMMAFMLITLYAQGSYPHKKRALEKPNILFILTDDQRWDAVGAYGNKDIITPNMDSLSQEGMRFDAAYIASPLCCPSRSVFLTGLYPHQTGVVNNRPDVAKIRSDLPTIAKLLNRAGYLTGFIGKAHLDGKPKAWGFKDVPVFLPGGGSRHQNPILVVQGKEEKLPGVIKINKDGEEEIHPLPEARKKNKKWRRRKRGIVVQGLITEIFTDAAVKFLEQHKKERWFLWFSTTAPHKPYYHDPHFVYDPDAISPPPGYPEEVLGDEDWAGYYSTISHLDFQLGRIFKKLRDLGLDQNTIIIFTSDNGFMMGSHGLQGKQVWYEESVRMPWIVRWSGRVKSGKIVSSPISSADFFPTLLDLAGADLPKRYSYEGRSFLPLLGLPTHLHKESKPRKVIFSEVKQRAFLGGHLWQMVMKDQWKYVWFENGGELLYNLQSDPSERVDLSQQKFYRQKLETMRALRARWLKQTPPIPAP